MIFLLLLGFVLLNMFTSYLNIKNTVQRSVANQNLLVAKSVASTLDIEAYKRFLKNPVKSQEYEDIKAYLENVRENVGVVHIYTLKVENPQESRTMIAGLPENVKREPEIGELCTVPERQVDRPIREKTPSRIFWMTPYMGSI